MPGAGQKGARFGQLVRDSWGPCFAAALLPIALLVVGSNSGPLVAAVVLAGIVLPAAAASLIGSFETADWSPARLVARGAAAVAANGGALLLFVFGPVPEPEDSGWLVVFAVFVVSGGLAAASAATLLCRAMMRRRIGSRAWSGSRFNKRWVWVGTSGILGAVASYGLVVVSPSETARFALLLIPPALAAPACLAGSFVAVLQEEAAHRSSA